jgi:hypothetical protein
MFPRTDFAYDAERDIYHRIDGLLAKDGVPRISPPLASSERQRSYRPDERRQNRSP